MDFLPGVFDGNQVLLQDKLAVFFLYRKFVKNKLKCKEMKVVLPKNTEGNQWINTKHNEWLLFNDWDISKGLCAGKPGKNIQLNIYKVFKKQHPQVNRFNMCN